jgi:hypothetical protein
MQKKKSNKREVALTFFLISLAIIAALFGVWFCVLGTKELIGVTDIDVNILLRDPSEYIAAKREVAMTGLQALIPGIVLLVIGAVVFSIFMTRLLTILHEGRAISRIESRLDALEKKSKK